MKRKRILLTGATDGIGLETAKSLSALGHHLLLHGRSRAKLESVLQSLKESDSAVEVETYVADLSNLDTVSALAGSVQARHKSIDVLINNAGVFVTNKPRTDSGLDVRFVVNTIAPYVLTKHLLPSMPSDGRVINLSSAAQSSVDLDAFLGHGDLTDSQAYAQSKLAITMWTNYLEFHLSGASPSIISVNPGSFLGSKMVREAYGQEGKDLRIGARILVRAALSDEFDGKSGQYFDNDSGQFASPHPDALDMQQCEAVVKAMDSIV
ncbi:MAG TPA: oxidoreductase [Planctomycetaceae bacterium]|nr:oxidoreductase [Planctomycetaceae bacterium]